MSVDYENHRILHHLDDPFRFLFWTIDEAAAIFLPFMMGLLVDQLTVGIFCSGFGFFLLRKLKKKFGNGSLRHFLYWYMPHNKQLYKKTPPSYKREFLG